MILEKRGGCNVGGSGSGNHYHWWRPGKKTVVEDCLSIDANRWMREGILRASVHLTGGWNWTYRSGGKCSISYEVRTLDMTRPLLFLSYSWKNPDTGQKETIACPVHLETTRPRFGGLRWWFICPLNRNGRPCNRRVGKLYLPPRGRYFGCRHCYNLTYTSCQESRKNDALYRFMARNSGMDFDLVKRAMDGLGKR
jgi:hypothetical protein